MVAFAVFLGVQIVFLAFADAAEGDVLLTNGLYVSVTTIMGGLAGTAVLFATVHARFVVRDYLSLRWPPLRTLVLWTLAGVGFWAAFGGVASLLDRPMPQFMVDIYVTAGSPPLLFVALVVFAPLFEETLFRGFLFRGWSRSPLRASGTIALTAALWAALHVQYDAFIVGGLFLYGVLLGTARQRTGTLVVPLLLHALTNAAAFAQMAFGAAGS